MMDIIELMKPAKSKLFIKRMFLFVSFKMITVASSAALMLEIEQI
jgi:hypothetical protein